MKTRNSNKQVTVIEVSQSTGCCQPASVKEAPIAQDSSSSTNSIQTPTSCCG